MVVLCVKETGFPHRSLAVIGDTICNDPEEVAEKIRVLHSDVGGFGTLLAMGHEWRPFDEWVESMTLLSKEVMPRLENLDLSI